eukprot:CAMPEP_0185856112 /NCGR_PEP_ID=MMETSP1354-20130828/27940_1 /TAXON_ID=708628 /ORGANISM="Erythrolobus madagascarensis, Strain CCMP3276" /LENGTH=141 /DNA_ID=CAMNT_0028558279 /DNA_START=34 /DNA_END=456 /DNA_ORIENTATION=-
MTESQAWRVSIQNLVCSGSTSEEDDFGLRSHSCGSAATNTPQDKLHSKRWTKAEDDLLVQLVNKNGAVGWTTYAAVYFDGKRDGGALRARYYNNLLPNREPRKPWTPKEDCFIVKRRKEIGNKWTVIASDLEGRSGNDVKN